MKIVTALNNPKINKELKKENNYEIIGKDIQYKEAILDILKKNYGIELIILDADIPGEISLEKLIKEIKVINKKVRIILFLNKKNLEKENNFQKLGIREIYNKKSINKETLEEIIKNKTISINNLRDSKIITIFKCDNYKRNLVEILLIKIINSNNKKILIINPNKKIENEYFYFEYKKFNKNNKAKINKIELEKIKINKNIDMIYNLNILFNKKDYKNFKNKFISELLLKNKKIYDYIIINMDYNFDKFVRRKILEISEKIVLELGEGLLGIKEIQELMCEDKKAFSKAKKGLHIVKNTENLITINTKILRSIIPKNTKIIKINYKKLMKKLEKDFNKFKLNKIKEKKFNQIIN